MIQSLLEVSTALSYEDFARGVVKFLGTSLDFHAAEVRLCVFDEATERALHLSGNFSAKAAHSAEELKLRKGETGP